MEIVSPIIFIVNLLLVLLAIFKERKKPESIIPWLLLFSLIPIIGFLIYVFIGGGLSIKNRNMLKRRKFYDDNYMNYYHKLIDENEKIKNKKVSSLIRFNIVNDRSVPTFNNDIKFFTDGNEKIASLIKDINSAKHSINIEYYIFGDDEIGQKVMNALIEKAQEGVAVNLIYDSVGSLKTPRRFFYPLMKAGGNVKEFFPPLFNIRLINLKMNYRNHRKIVVIDGKIGYIGGINIRGDHCGKVPRLAPWSDAHIRVEGQFVYSLQNEFLNFWQFCNKENVETKKYVDEGYFPITKSKGNSIMQVVSSGPDDTCEKVKNSYIRLMQIAEKEIIIQTPYFVPDDIFMNSLKLAILNGIKVKLILPGKPDKKMVYFATMSFAREILEMGGEVYTFNGFLHAKTMIVDDYVMSLGTANIDNRSFALNFEINSIIYDKEKVKEYRGYVKHVIENSSKITMEYYTQKSWWIKLQSLFFRLFAPLL